MATRLVIDGNSVYDVEEDWEESNEDKKKQEKQSRDPIPKILFDKSLSETNRI